MSDFIEDVLDCIFDILLAPIRWFRDIVEDIFF